MAGNGMWMPKSAFLSLNRKHVTDAAGWAYEAGTDFWLIPGLLISGAAGTTSLRNIVEFGWTVTTPTEVAPSGADFMSSADKGVPIHLLFDTAADLVSSPAIFGSYDHALMAQHIAGMNKLPRTLNAEFWGFFTANGAFPLSGFGFVEDTGSPVTANDQIAYISTDGTNFQLAANGGAGALTDTGAVDDTAWHLWKISLDRVDSLAYWYIDGTLQGSVAITADEFPCKFGAGEGAAGTNDPGLGITHIYYDW